MSRVKACPFCGGLAKSKSYYSSYEGTRYFIECIQCGATSSHRPTKENAIDKWNSRVELMELRNADNVKPKKYYLRHKYLREEGLNYLSLNTFYNRFDVEHPDECEFLKTQFTEEEIKEIEEKGFDLTNFEKIEVK